VNQQHAIDRGVRSGNSNSSTSADSVGRTVAISPRPAPAGMKAKAPLGLLAEQAEIGSGIADAEHAQALHLAPMLADAAPTKCRPQCPAAGVEGNADRPRRWTWRNCITNLLEFRAFKFIAMP